MIQRGGLMCIRQMVDSESVFIARQPGFRERSRTRTAQDRSSKDVKPGAFRSPSKKTGAQLMMQVSLWRLPHLSVRPKALVTPEYVS